MGDGTFKVPKLVRYPVIALSYEDRDIAEPRELIIDYNNGNLYILNDQGEYIDITAGLFDHLDGDEVDVLVDGIIMTLTQALLRLEKIKYNTEFVIGGYTIINTLNTPRGELAGAGAQNSSLAFGGNSGTYSAVTEKFNGDVWSNSGLMNTPRSRLAGCGTQNAALAFGGYNGEVLTVTEKFDGEVWSLGANLNIDRYGLAGCGIQDAALAFGGWLTTAATEKYDGLIWSNTGGMVTARTGLGGVGIQNAALSFGGYTVIAVANTEKFDGLVWSDTGSLNTARNALAGGGLQDSGLSFGGVANSVYLSNVETFDGTTWTNSIAMNIARGNLAGSGTQNAALSFGGIDSSGYLSATEKFDGAIWVKRENVNIKNVPALNKDGVLEVNTIGDARTVSGGYLVDDLDIPTSKSLWSASKISSELGEKYDSTSDILDSAVSNTMELNTFRYDLGAAGTQSASLAFGGTHTSIMASTEKFDGTVWSNIGNLNTARKGLAGCGLQDAALSFGGRVTDASVSVVTEKFNGNVWSVSGNLNTARRDLTGCGEQTAALSFGGYSAAVLGVTEIFNGSLWSNTGGLITVRTGLAGCGIQTSALSSGGFTTIPSNACEKFNGTMWSTTGNLITARYHLEACGYTDNALSFGGYTTVPLGKTEKFNGTVWSASRDLNVARYYLGGSGSPSAGLAFGGTGDTLFKSTEKFNISEWIISLGADIGDLLDRKLDKTGGRMTGELIAPLITGDIINANYVTGAVWNDYAEYRQAIDFIDAGCVVVEDPDDGSEYIVLSNDRLLPNPMVVSDTWGFAVGKQHITGEFSLPVALSGRVLAHTYEDRSTFKKGDVVCSGPNGTVSKMTREEIVNYPDRILGIVSSIPNYIAWGPNSILINNRIWIKVR